MMIVTLLLCEGLCVASLLTPGYVRHGPWHVAFLAVTVTAGVMATIVILLQQLTPAVEATMLYGTDIAIVVALAGLSDRGGARVGLLLVLPMVFFALFLGFRSMQLQAVIVVAAGTLLMWLGGDRAAVLAIHTFMVAISAFVSAWSIRVVRSQLGLSLARERDSAITRYPHRSGKPARARRPRVRAIPGHLPAGRHHHRPAADRS